MEKITLGPLGNHVSGVCKKGKRYSEKEKISYCKKWKVADVSQKAFCKHQGISTKSLRHWLKLFAGSDREVKLLPVSVESNSQKKKNTGPLCIEIRLPGGSEMKIPCKLTRATARFIKEVIR